MKGGVLGPFLTEHSCVTTSCGRARAAISSREMRGVTIRLLGGFDVVVDGAEVPNSAWRHRRGADLVKLLALSAGNRVHREHAMAALWPELDTDAAAANLRKAVHFARRAIGSEDAVTTDGAMVTLWPDRKVLVDLH